MAATYAGLDLQYGELSGRVPARVSIRSAPKLDLTIALTQVDVNGTVQSAALTALVIPPGTAPMTLDDLRRTGPFAP